MARKGRKIKAQDFFYAEWAAHEAAKAEEERHPDFLTEFNEPEYDDPSLDKPETMEVGNVIA
jgi:hypothetical protein